MIESNFKTLIDIKKKEGIEKYKSAFHQLSLSENAKAIEFINHPALSFSDFYLLIPELDELNLYQELNPRNITALKLCARILKNKLLTAKIYFLSGENDETNHPVLIWMIFSGIDSDGLDNDFDHIIDGAAALLLSTYNEPDILPTITDLIFKRNEKGEYNHDLIWALFQSHNPNVITLIADHLNSSNPKEVALCECLLHYKNPGKKPNKNRLTYKSYIEWLQNNSPYFNFTEQSFQYASDPEYFKVDLEAKYLCRPDYKNKTSFVPLTESGRNHLMGFRKLSEDDQQILSEYANHLYQQNAQAWQKWIHYSVQEQLAIAKKALEVQNDTDSE